MLFIGADHGGFALKEGLKKFLASQGIVFQDLGTFSEESMDYPDVAILLAKKVAEDADARGILCCGTGEGVCIAANKVKGIRAALVYDDASAKGASEHNHANVVCFGGRTMKLADVERWVGIWRSTPFGGERHQRRIDKINGFEREQQ